MQLRCDFCGSNEDAVRYTSVPTRFTLYRFCQLKDCYIKYHNYVYKRDLTYGVPYAITVRHTPINGILRCSYCGDSGKHVIKSYLSPSLEFESFCKNDSCCRRFYDIINHRNPLSSSSDEPMEIDK